MITINLYQPGKLNVYIQFPTEWNELLSSEVVEISKQQLLLAAHPEAAKAAILHFILRTRAKLQKVKLPTGWVKLMDVEQAVMNGYPLLDFLYDENSLTQTPENRIKFPGVIPCAVYGPHNGFENLTCGEFEDAEIFFHEFIEDPDILPLAKLASVLWRPSSSVFKTIRKPYITDYSYHSIRTYNAEKNVNCFLKLAPWRLYSIFVWYTGCRNRLPLMFPTVHEKYGNEPEPDAPDIIAFTKCIHAGAGVKNGSRNQIRMSRLFEFMFEMEQEAIKAKEMREEYEKAKNK